MMKEVLLIKIKNAIANGHLITVNDTVKMTMMESCAVTIDLVGCTGSPEAFNKIASDAELVSLQMIGEFGETYELTGICTGLAVEYSVAKPKVNFVLVSVSEMTYRAAPAKGEPNENN